MKTFITTALVLGAILTFGTNQSAEAYYGYYGGPTVVVDYGYPYYGGYGYSYYGGGIIPNILSHIF